MKIISNSYINRRYLLVDINKRCSLNCPVCGALKSEDQGRDWCYMCWPCVDYVQEKYGGQIVHKVFMWVANNQGLLSPEIEILEDFPTREL